KTIIFRLMDDQMYWHMSKGDNNMIIERGEALHKMVRLVTLATNGGAYLNFMGNEFGHPEWIDFPRQGNGWSYKYARRQWSLVDREDLKYSYLNAFDKAMIGTVKNMSHFSSSPITKIWDNDGDQILAFMRKELLFVFNFNPLKSFTDYGMLVPKGSYTMELDSDSPCFGGFGRVDDTIAHFTNFDPLYKNDNKEWIKLYLPARTAMVLKLIKIKR
ncbi:MAG: alpha amylase C-terminal domain-containing protein, partial [Bacteroidales bacterium]